MGDSKLFYILTSFRSFRHMLMRALRISFAYQLWKGAGIAQSV
jgi:multidrug transporter EmrE-like cation transporter